MNAGEQGRTLRNYRGVIAAEGRLEKAVLSGLKERMEGESFWEPVPESSRRESMRSLNFLIFGRLIAMVSVILEIHMGYPFRLFLLLAHPELAPDIENDCKCLFDEWTKRWVEQFLEKGIASAEALMDLRTLLLFLKLDTASVEASHATLRRLLHMMSTQTWLEAVPSLSAQEVLRKFRKIKERVRTLLEVGEAEGRVAEKGGDGQPARKRILNSGPWRCFVALSEGSGSYDFTYLARLFNALSSTEKERLWFSQPT